MEEKRMQLNKDYEPEINLKGMIFHILYRWRSILLAALICAVALGAYQYFSLKSVHDAGNKTAEEQKYEQDLAAYEEELEIAQNVVDRNTILLQSQTNYLNNSAYIKLDPNAIWTARCNYVIKVDPSVLENLPQGSTQDPADGILSAYNVPLEGASEEELMEAFEVDQTEYVRELVTVLLDPESNTVTYSVYGKSKEAAQKGMRLLQSKMGAVEAKAQEIERHTAAMTGGEVSCVSNDILLSKQDQLSKSVNQLKRDLRNAKLNLKKMQQSAPGAPGNHLVRMTVIGAVLGALVLAFLYAVHYVLSRKLENNGVLSDQFNIPILGSISRSSSVHKDRGPDKILAGWELGKNREAPDITYSNISALISEKAEGQKIILASTLPESELGSLKEALASRAPDKTIDVKGSFLRNSEAITAAADADAVVLAEKKGLSRNRDIERMAELLMIPGAKVIGAVIL